MVSDFIQRRDRGAARLRLACGATTGIFIVICMLVVGHDLLRTWLDRHRQIENIRREVANLTLAADQQAEDVFQLTDTVLAGLAERVEADGTGPAQVDRLLRVMAARQLLTPALLNQAVIDEDGNLVAAGVPLNMPLNLADRPYFRYHKAHPDGRLYVSEILRSRRVDQRVMAVSRRVGGKVLVPDAVQRSIRCAAEPGPT